MTRDQIQSWIMQATRYKLHPDQVILIMDAAQKMAFDQNYESFLVWNEALIPQVTLTFNPGTYILATDADVGSPVLGGTSGSTGTLLAYDNAAYTWQVETQSEFEDGEYVTLSAGIGEGNLAASDAIEVFLGPYDAPVAPVSPPCRKIWGVTLETDGRIFGTSTDTDLFPMNDFDFRGRTFDPTRFFQPGREDNVNKTFTFAQTPTLSAAYRWVYWRDAPTISTVDEGADIEGHILIPSAYHTNFINVCLKLAQLNLSGEDVNPKDVQALFQPWWNTLRRPYTPMGKATNQTLNRRGSSQSLI